MKNEQFDDEHVMKKSECLMIVWKLHHFTKWRNLPEAYRSQRDLWRLTLPTTSNDVLSGHLNWSTNCSSMFYWLWVGRPHHFSSITISACNVVAFDHLKQAVFPADDMNIFQNTKSLTILMEKTHVSTPSYLSTCNMHRIKTCVVNSTMEGGYQWELDGIKLGLAANTPCR